MEEIAFGLMGLSVEEFYNMIPRHFFNKMSGFYELLSLKEKHEWERVRWQTAVLVNLQIPKGKRIKPTDLIQFDWDKKKREVDYKKLKERAEYIKRIEELKKDGK